MLWIGRTPWKKWLAWRVEEGACHKHGGAALRHAGLPAPPSLPVLTTGCGARGPTRCQVPSTRHARAMATIAFLISSGRPGHAMTTPARSAGISRAVVLILCSRCADIVFRERPAFGGVASGSVRNSATRQSLSPCCCPDCDTTRPARDALRPVPDR